MPDRQTEKKNTKPYFDIEGLIAGQSILLDSISPSFLKTVSVDGKEEAIRGHNPHGGWSEELQLFNELDLNKPNLYDKYDLKETLTDTVITLLYSSLSSNTTPIDTLIITLDDASKKPLKIHGIAHTSNLLFESRQVTDLTFSKAEHGPAITSFRLVRSQKLMGNKPSLFSLYIEL